MLGNLIACEKASRLAYIANDEGKKAGRIISDAFVSERKYRVLHQSKNSTFQR